MKRKKNILKNILRYALLLCLFIFSFFFLSKDLKLSELKIAFGYIDVKFIIFAIILVVIQIFLQAINYLIMGRGLGLNISVFKSFLYCSVDLFFSQVTPFAVGGQPAMVYEMKKKDDYPVAKTTTMALLHAFLNKLSLIICVIVAAIFCFNEYFVYNSDNKLLFYLLILGIITNLIIGFISFSMMFMGPFAYKMGTRMILWFNKLKLIKKPIEKCNALRLSIINFKKSNEYMKTHVTTSLLVLFICIIKRIATFSIAFLVYKSFGFKEYGFISIIFAQTIYTVISDSFIVPGGIGVAETSIKSIYDKIYASFGNGIGDVAALIVRVISYYILLIISGISTLMLFIIKKRKKVIIDEK